MTRTRVLAALLAGLTLAGLGTAATALGSDDPAPAAGGRRRPDPRGDARGHRESDRLRPRPPTPSPASRTTRTGDDRSDDHGAAATAATTAPATTASTTTSTTDGGDR